MKRIANYLIALAVAAFTFTSCEDVPSPFGEIVKPATDDVVAIEPSGSGTEADPYNVAGVLEFISGLGADTPSDKEVYIKGYAVELTDISAQYGNATFIMSDNEEGTANKFTVYRAAGLGNEKVTDANFIKQGDVVVVCGKVTNYKGNTPETVQGSAYVYSVNGNKGSGGGGGGTTTETLGTKDEPLTIAKALELINALADGGESDANAYVKGKVVKVTTNADNFAKYGNLNYIISEDGTDNGKTITVYSGDGLDGAKFSSNTDLAQGDEVIVFGKLYKYVKDGKVTPEIAKGNYLVSLVKGSGGGGGDEPSGDAKGTGTKDDPFNIAAAIAKCKEIGETASTEKYYVKGIVVKGGKASGGYGNVTFDMGDTKDATDLFKAYQVAGSDGEKLADGYEVKTGDEVIVYGPIYNYQGKTPETAGKSAAQIVTINGKKTNDNGGGGETSGTGTLDNPLTASQIYDIVAAMEKDKTSSEDYYVKGKICSVKYTFSADYGTATFNISDDGKTGGKEFTAYSTYYKASGQKWKDGDTQVAVGDEVVICGKVVNYGGNTPEFASKKSYVVTINGK